MPESKRIIHAPILHKAAIENTAVQQGVKTDPKYKNGDNQRFQTEG